MKPVIKINIEKLVANHPNGTHSDIETQLLKAIRSAMSPQASESYAPFDLATSMKNNIEILHKEKNRALERLQEVSDRLTQPYNKNLAGSFQLQHLKKVHEAAQRLLAVESALQAFQ